MGRKSGLPKLYKQRDSEFYWCRFTVHGKRCRFSTGTRDRGVAEETAQKIYAEAALSRKPNTKRRVGFAAATSLDMLVAEYLVWTRANGKAESYVIKQAQHFKAHFLRVWKRLSDITTESIENYKVMRKREGISSVTVYKELVTLSRFLRWCTKIKGALAEAPTFDRIKPVSNYSAPMLSPADVKSLLSHLPDRYTHRQKCPVREYFTVQWAQAMRPGEVASLRWSDVDFRRREIIIRQANDKARVMGGRPIAMHDRAYEILRDMAKEPHLPNGLIFGKADYRLSIRAATKAAGLPNITPHHLRHARLTELASSTRDTAAVQYLAGHKSLATTDRYVKSRVERTRKIFDEHVEDDSKTEESSHQKRNEKSF